jgi:hypothetical protein
MHLVGSLFDVFRLPRIELNEVKDCLELNMFCRNALILHDLLAQLIDNAFVIVILFSMQCARKWVIAGVKN